MTSAQFCLGSASPRRAQLLLQLGYHFNTAAADIDETQLPGEPAEAYVRRMALEKGAALQQRNTDLLILSADTIVVLGDELLGKPSDTDHAEAMLMRLSGCSHRVLTSVAISGVNQSPLAIVQTSTVRFTELNADDIQRYIATGEPMDKAGAYGIQGYAACFVEHLRGSYSGVMGLPLFETAQLLEQAGIRWAAE